MASTSRSVAAARSASSAKSGCGKSVLSLSVMRLVPPPGRIAAGQIMFDGRNLLDLSPAQMRDIRGNRIAMIFQEPMTSLNPVFTVGDQITEAMRAHDRTASARRAAQPRDRRACSACASPRRSAGSTNTRTRCPAACVSA